MVAGVSGSWWSGERLEMKCELFLLETGRQLSTSHLMNYLIRNSHTKDRGGGESV